MKEITIPGAGLKVPAIAVGCMRMGGISDDAAAEYVKEALNLGLNFFDHADIYADGESESRFGRAVRALGVSRDKLIIQSKCGIVPGIMYDFSKEHILEAVEGSLKRLGTDYLDFLLLHRPDALMEPEEVAEAFDELKGAGKVRFFGVSNQSPMQMELLKRYLNVPICANQLQLSLCHTIMIDRGIHVNMLDDAAVDRDGGVLDYCRLNDITIQPWSPFQYGFFEGVFIGSDKYPELNSAIDRIALNRGVSREAVALAWLIRHPAGMQPVVGTMNPQRLRACAQAGSFELSREEWYELYTAAGNCLP